MKKILITGGLGYIGSHTVVALLDAGYQAIVVDNLSNSDKEVLNRIKELTGKQVSFYQVDIRDRAGLNHVFRKETCDCVIHFAGLKSLEESIYKPWEYYDNNVGGTLTLIDVMREYGCKNMIFSSSAAVYGTPEQLPITEECPKGERMNPYAQTKSMQEQILMDIQKADPDWNVVLLRYFNPIGAHKSGLLGEDPQGIPNNLLPYITQVAIGKLPYLKIFGNDYDTPDGTGIRDYIHVLDLANGHLKALSRIQANCGCEVFNLGTGTGYSVLEMVHYFEQACGKKIPYQIEPRRLGDVAACFADPSKAKRLLGWEAQNGVLEMCKDAWRWQNKNPNGYKK